MSDMRVAVAGGTGVVGRHVVETARSRGHDVRVLARAEGVDLTTGDGLARHLDGVETVIDTTNAGTQNRARATAFFEATVGHLERAGTEAGVAHLVSLSIVGIDRVPTGYYRAKRRQEELVAAGGLPWTILRATQFHEFAQQVLGFASAGPVVLVPRTRSQTIAAAEVAGFLVDAAEAGPAGRLPDVAGPEVHLMPDLVRQVIRARGERRLVVPVPLPGAGRAAATGGLLPQATGPRGTQTFEEWLAS